jgi:hypothetical protein
VKRAAMVLLTLAFAQACMLTAYAGCRVFRNEHVALYGTSDDPDVFLWDSRFRLREYEGGTFDQMQALLPHALLVPAGSRAVVIDCVHDFVQPKYERRPQDAVGVVILSGAFRGRRGWVIGGAAREMRRREARWASRHVPR